jgi:hypothetical protein
VRLERELRLQLGAHFHGFLDRHFFESSDRKQCDARRVGKESRQVGAGGRERTGEKRLEISRRMEGSQKVSAGGRIPQQQVVIRRAGRGALGQLLHPHQESNSFKPGPLRSDFYRCGC